MIKKSIVLFAGVSIGVFATKILDEKKIKILQELSDRHCNLFMLMNRWVSVKQQNKKLADWFIERGYHTIAIYGMSHVGESLQAELENSTVQVKYGIDKRADYIFNSKVDIFLPTDHLEPIDAVVVTAITFFDEIKEELKEKFSCPIVSLREIVSAF